LFNNKDSLPYTFRLHIAAVLKDWADSLRADEPLPAPAREVGLLALYILDAVKKTYRKDEWRKEILRIIIKTSSAIAEDFTALAEKDILLTSRGTDRPPYADDFCELIFSVIESAFVCTHHSDLLIKLAYSEWFIPEQPQTNGPRFRHPTDRREQFGILEFNRNFVFSASGAKGPFKHLLYHHPVKAINFILGICNKAAEKYAHSGYDRYHSRELSAPFIERIEIQLNDGEVIQQYCSWDFWIAYLGLSGVPLLLGCALMALENWLILYTELVDTDAVEQMFHRILRNSNSVMPTAVLASVATGFPDKAGKAALPFLRVPELYSLDRGRLVNERGGIPFLGFGVEPLADFYAEERRTAAGRPWRKEDLEILIVRLQLSSQWREDALAAVDTLMESVNDSDEMRFLLHRIDTRKLKAVPDEANNRIIFEPEELEADLQERQQRIQEDMEDINRFSALFLWATGIIEREPEKYRYYQSWRQALEESKALHKIIERDTLHGGASIVKAAAVFIRDYCNQLNQEDMLWCAALISQAVRKDADEKYYSAASAYNDKDSAATAASVLPVLLDIADNDEKRLDIKRLIAIALTHANEKVRLQAAHGIREHLWQRDPEFAKKCIAGTIRCARFEKEHEIETRLVSIRYQHGSRWGINEDEEKANNTQWQMQKDAFRDQFARGELGDELEQISFATHSSWCILPPCVMIPNGSRELKHVELFSQMLKLFFRIEQDREQENRLQINPDITSGLIQRFANYLFPLHSSDFQDYIDLLKSGCEIAPYFTYSVLHVAGVSERQERNEIYWQLWGQLSETVQQIALKESVEDSRDRKQGESKKIIRGMLHADTPWKKFNHDHESQRIALGKELLLEFAENAGTNQDVFEALAALIYHFPKIFFEKGIHILARHQDEAKGNHLISNSNTAFYLENAIQRFLQIDHPGPLPRKMHDSCFTLLNALVETASSRAYYLREHLIRSRKTC
jgi:hypothetical protein